MIEQGLEGNQPADLSKHILHGLFPPMILRLSILLDKFSLTDKSKLDGQSKLFIRLVPDKTNKTLSIIHNGISMTKAYLVNNLGIIARSGTNTPSWS
ncbi:hypothetical protein AALP_AAs45060U000400 [Arabis alpina]|uniref:Uncharacterized protein n=1 Tax=Arabis alpina TaxID=50452 RepID=A0A087FYC9_ARAAL|nr:hypothetical protein AALP_AAs45060U000400 [Arabis alpina]